MAFLLIFKFSNLQAFAKDDRVILHKTYGIDFIRRKSLFIFARFTTSWLAVYRCCTSDTPCYNLYVKM